MAVKINITIDDIRLRSKFTTDKTIKFIEKSFLNTSLDFTQSHPGALGDFERFVRLIPGSYRGDEPVNSTGVDKIYFKIGLYYWQFCNWNTRSCFVQFCIG